MKVAMRRRPRERRVEILAMGLECPLLKIGVPDGGMDRGEPVERPAFRRGETQPSPCGAVASDFDVDLKIRRLREWNPHFAAQRHAPPLCRRQQPRVADERAAPVRHARACRRGTQTGDGDADEILASLGLLKERGGADVDDRLLRGAATDRPPTRERGEETQERPTIRTQHDSYNLALLDCAGPLCTFPSPDPVPQQELA